MSRLEEIENAAEQLSVEEKQELLLFLASKLRAEGGVMPPPRQFSAAQVNAWIAEDEEGYRRFRNGA